MPTSWVAADGSGPVTVESVDDSGAQLMTPAVSPGGRLAHLRTTAAPSASRTLMSSLAERLEVSRRLRTEGCCDPGSAL
ncbi:hypothetical protein TUSST3_11740 [Streptomyces sp. TUS-ST3]|nr:hypothetical protein TUSST3_11740 [Streptomyces sp. TUS-ST3]